MLSRIILSWNAKSALVKNTTIIVGSLGLFRCVGYGSAFYLKDMDEGLLKDLMKTQTKQAHELLMIKDETLVTLASIPIHATLEEIVFRDCLMMYLLKTRLGFGSLVANAIQSVCFSSAHGSATEEYRKQNPSIKDDKNIEKALSTYDKNYYISIGTAGFILGGAALLSGTIWVPSVIHTLHNIRVFKNHETLD
jgi:membrane protease YdiL (CAAX protease family)